MTYKSLRDCVNDLENNRKLLRIKEEVDPNLEMAEIHRQVYDRQGPAILFEKVKGSPFQAVSNIYGTNERTEFVFRHTLPRLQKLIEIKADPSRLLKNPFQYWDVPFTALKGLPMKSYLNKPVMYGETTISQLPQVKSWPMDGGAFITLPQVLSMDPERSGIMSSNVGMYRVQLSGNEYIKDAEIGLHYQIHRGIGVHHEKYNRLNLPFRVSIFIGGPPAHAFSAIMPLPEGLSELTFGGLLTGRRFRYFEKNQHIISSDADFCITGTILPGVKKPEGPFGDHLGYYSLTHDFPVMKVEKVYHRKDPLWHFTVVGRPPQEDSGFGYLIHRIVGPLTSAEFPGLVDVHAVDVAGVHPLLLAIGKERYMPFREKKPEEILTIANHLLGKGQTSLTKYLFIAADGDTDVPLDTHNFKRYFSHVFERVRWERDLHFQTNTTIDTLDYSGSGWNSGSKVVIACCGEPVRELVKEVPAALKLTNDFNNPELALPGVLVIQGKKFEHSSNNEEALKNLILQLEGQLLGGIALIVLVDDSKFASQDLSNFLWVTFTRSNPSHDIYGVFAFTKFKHWGCKGPVIIDARIKPHHAPVLEKDEKITEKVEKLLSGYQL
jgi:4-hydroxy-3-polyprenylbenzoate decarboxylase